MVKAIMKNGNVVSVRSKLGVSVMAHHPMFNQFKTARGAFTSVRKALGMVNIYNEKVIMIGA